MISFARANIIFLQCVLTKVIFLVRRGTCVRSRVSLLPNSSIFHIFFSKKYTDFSYFCFKHRWSVEQLQDRRTWTSSYTSLPCHVCRLDHIKPCLVVNKSTWNDGYYPEMSIKQGRKVISRQWWWLSLVWVLWNDEINLEIKVMLEMGYFREFTLSNLLIM